jgi:endo-1,4-beta-xylanase
MRRRSLLAAGVVLALAACGAGGRPGLQTLAARRGLVWGSALGDDGLAQPDLLSLLRHNAAAITPENALKWDATEPEPGRFDFSRADQALAFASRHGLQLRGHALVWHRQLPPWLQRLPAAELRQALARHIRTVASHGRGRIQSWDVVNESLDEEGNGLRRSIWLTTLGPGYIADALRWARQADPHARLVINDYGLEGDDPQTARKRQAMLDLIDALQRQKAPLDAIGLQGHLVAPRDGTPRFRTLPAFLEQLRRRGLTVEITELDVSDRELPADIGLRDSRVADTYDAFLAAVLAEPALKQITSWGLSDRSTWLNDAFPRSDGLPQRPLPYDAALQPKAARSSIAARLQQPGPRR